MNTEAEAMESPTHARRTPIHPPTVIATKLGDDRRSRVKILQSDDEFGQGEFGDEDEDR